MAGTITKRDILKVLRYFGFKKAIRFLFSKDKTALMVLIS